jgi:hypothetical protein
MSFCVVANTTARRRRELCDRVSQAGGRGLRSSVPLPRNSYFSRESTLSRHARDSRFIEGRRHPRRRRSRRWTAVRTAAALTIRAPRERLVKLYLDYHHWAQLFPSTVREARLLKEEADRIVLAVDHKTEGHVVNVLKVRSPYEIELDERTPQSSAAFISRFESEGDATRLVVVADVRLKMPYAIFAPFLGAYIRHRIRRFVLEPMRAAIEAAP